MNLKEHHHKFIEFFIEFEAYLKYIQLKVALG